MLIEKNQFYNYEFPCDNVIIQFKGYVTKDDEPTYCWQLRINGVLIEEQTFTNFIDWTVYNTNQRAEYKK